ncbi:MAG: DUF1217 domain-containing protein [Methylovirgula sp.]
MLSTLLQYQAYTRNEALTLKNIASAPAVAQQTAYFQANIGKVTSVDDFLKNYRLFSYAMEAYGLSDMTFATAFMKNVLESNLNDPKSFVNTLSDSRYKTFAQAFNFNTNGEIASSATVQSSNQSDEMLGLYTAQSASTAKMASDATTAYEADIKSVKTVDDLLNNQATYSYVLSAYGLSEDSANSDAATVKATVKKVLESDPSNSNSFVAQLNDPRYTALAKAFNFAPDGTILAGMITQPDGSVVFGPTAQSDTQLASTVQAYGNHYDDAAALPDQLATAYYQANIGSVTSIDALIKDPKLYDYALTSYGIDPSTVSTQTIALALKSNPNDPSSFANLYPNHQFRDLAAAFNFTASGSVPAGQTAQSASQQQDTISNHQLRSTQSINSADDATSYFQANIGMVTSVDSLLQDGKLYDYALTAVGLDPNSVSQATIKSVLESNPNDPTSFAAKLNDPRYLNLEAAFNFTSNGGIVQGQTAQSATQTATLTGLYQSSASDAASNTAYYQANIGSVTSVDDLLNNPKLYSYLLRTYNLNANSTTQSTAEVKATIKQVLESNPNDPTSEAGTLGTPFTTMAANFNFASDGTLQSGMAAQTATQIQTMTDTYAAHVNDNSAAADRLAASYFQANIGNVKSVDDLIADPVLYNVALTAFGLNPSTESKATIRAVLLSDASGGNHTANTMTDQRYGDLAAAFNFTSSGSVASAPVTQTATDVTATINAYAKLQPALAKAATDAAAVYYQANINQATTVDKFLADPKLTSFALQAYGLDNPPPSNDVLRKVLESDLSDPKSYANSLGDSRYVNFALAFNFGSDGNVVRQPTGQPMSREGALGIAAAFDRQTLEDRAGQSNPGVQLALYFQRNAPSITNAYDILADKSLLKVVQTALNIPASSSMQNIDIQAQTITQQLNLSDFQDPKKLNAFISRFAVLYDMQNPSSNSTDPILALFGVQTTSTGNGGTPNILTLFGG